MTRFHMMIAAGALALAASAASAQPAPTDQTPPPAADQSAPATAPDAAPAQPMGQAAQAPAATSAGANTNATVVNPGDAPPAQVQALAQGDNSLTSMSPVPDTPANRAKFGGPMSMTGKRTKPAGN
jgi:hypothetical protein